MLADQAWAREKLASVAGRVFSLAVGPLSAHWRIERRRPRRGRAAPAPSVRPATVACRRCRCRRSSPIPSRWNELVREDGDAELGGVLKDLARTMPWFVEETFAKALGPVAGQRVADAGRRLLAFPEYAAQRLSRKRGQLRARRSGTARDGARVPRCCVKASTKSRRASTRSPRASRRWRRASDRSADSVECRGQPAARRRSQRSPSSAGRGCTTSRSASGCSAARRAPRASRSCGSRARRARASPRSSRATSRRASCPGLWFQADPGDADPATFFHYVRIGAGEIPGTPRARRRSAAGVLRRVRGRPAGVHAPLHARALRAVSRRARCSSSTISTSPRPTPSWKLRVRRRAARDSRRHEPHLPVARAAGAGDGAARRRAAHHAHRVGSAALHDGRVGGADVERAGLAPDLARAIYKASDGWAAGIVLMREHLARNEGIAPEALLPEGKEAVFQYFTGEIFGRARAENQRVLMLAALLPSVSPADARGDLRQSGSAARARLRLPPAPVHRPAPHRRPAGLPVPRAVPRVPARGRAGGGCRGEDRAARRSTAPPDSSSRAATSTPPPRCTSRRRRGPRSSASRCTPDARCSRKAGARRSCSWLAAMPPDVRECGAAPGARRSVRGDVRRARALQGAARARVRGLRRAQRRAPAAAGRRRGGRLPLLRMGGLRAARPLDRRAHAAARSRTRVPVHRRRAAHSRRAAHRAAVPPARQPARSTTPRRTVETLLDAPDILDGAGQRSRERGVDPLQLQELEDQGRRAPTR